MNSDQSIVTFGFPAGRHMASFAELAARIGPGYQHLHATLPISLGPMRLRGHDYAAAWIKEIRRDGRRVRAVFGHRVGSVYAAAVAEGLARWQEPPVVVLFDPERASGPLLSQEFRGDIDATRSILSDDEIERAEKIAAGISDADTGSTAEALGRYLDVITVALERAGLGSLGSGKNTFTASFESYIAWISAASQIDPGRAWKRSTAIVSRDYAGPAFDDQIGFEVARADLLRSAYAAQAVGDLLTCRDVPDFLPSSNVAALT